MKQVGSTRLTSHERVTTGVGSVPGPPTQKRTRMAGCCDLHYLTMWFPWCYLLDLESAKITAKVSGKVATFTASKVRYRIYVHRLGKIGQRWEPLLALNQNGSGKLARSQNYVRKISLATANTISLAAVKAVHLCFIMSPGKMIFAVLELWLSPLQWVLNWLVFNIYVNNNKNLCGRDGRTICGPQRVPKSTCVSL